MVEAPNRPGFTIVEVLLALLLLSFTVLGFQAATGEIISHAAQSDRETVAIQLVEDRLDLIRLDPHYDSLGSRYTEAEAPLADYAGLTRTTVVAHTRVQQDNGGLLDYRTITVSIQGAGVSEPVARTVVVAAP